MEKPQAAAAGSVRKDSGRRCPSGCSRRKSGKKAEGGFYGKKLCDTQNQALRRDFLIPVGLRDPAGPGDGGFQESHGAGVLGMQSGHARLPGQGPIPAGHPVLRKCAAGVQGGEPYGGGLSGRQACGIPLQCLYAFFGCPERHRRGGAPPEGGGGQFLWRGLRIACAQ